MRRVLAALALVATLTACATGSSPGGRGQGIRGVVLAGPQCPVQTAESPCPPEPVANVRVSVSSGGDVVADATTDPKGRFTVAVDPGTYEVQAMPGQEGFLSSKPIRVVVRSGAYTDVTVAVDTGIR